MRVIIGAVFVVVMVGVFVALTAAMLIAQHLFATTVLGASVVAVMFMARRRKRRTRRERVSAHQPSHYPALLPPQRSAQAGPPQWAAHGMSSAALPSCARRRSYP